MNYPTMKQVEEGDKRQLARWYRHLRSPGQEAIGQPNFAEVLEAQAEVMNRICERFYHLGGMTPELSKEIGL